MSVCSGNKCQQGKNDFAIAVSTPDCTDGAEVSRLWDVLVTECSAVVAGLRPDLYNVLRVREAGTLCGGHPDGFVNRTTLDVAGACLRWQKKMSQPRAANVADEAASASIDVPTQRTISEIMPATTDTTVPFAIAAATTTATAVTGAAADTAVTTGTSPRRSNAANLRRRDRRDRRRRDRRELKERLENKKQLLQNDTKEQQQAIATSFTLPVEKAALAIGDSTEQGKAPQDTNKKRPLEEDCVLVAGKQPKTGGFLVVTDIAGNSDL